LDYDQTHWVPVRASRPLPTFYYHEHFVELLAFVERQYAHALDTAHVELIEDFRGLPKPAQCLYVRLVNRKGRVFGLDKLRYPELGDLRELAVVLREAGWIGHPGPGHFADLLRFLTRAEILDALKAQFAGLGRALRKDDLIAFALESADPEAFVESLATGRLCVQERCEAVGYLMFLYFGRIQDGLTRFTMRDLGLVRTNGSAGTYEPRFHDRDEALERFWFESRAHRLDRANPAELAALLAESAAWPEPNFAGSAASRDRLAFRLGRALEKLGDGEAALRAYGRGESPECGERQIRLLMAAGRRDEARRLLEARLAEPQSDEEWLFARDFFQRKFEKKRTSRQTDLLREGETIDIDESRSATPERAAAEDFEARGGRGEHHRVTEIGAVKVRGGEIVDRYATLVNPQRAIPPGITRLTGITEAMVSDAPCFADIADGFRAFLGDAIFVAHNVEFDYGFIAREFQRLGQPFRHAKLCTCASMRRLYPGQRSYSLASLSRAFGILLTSHHRALCDAEAAAELLFLVNDRRRELLA